MMVRLPLLLPLLQRVLLELPLLHRSSLIGVLHTLLPSLLLRSTPLLCGMRQQTVLHLLLLPTLL